MDMITSEIDCPYKDTAEAIRYNHGNGTAYRMMPHGSKVADIVLGAGWDQASPVIDDGALKGVVSIGDLTRWVSRNQEGHSQDLVNYITGKYPA